MLTRVHWLNFACGGCLYKGRRRALWCAAVSWKAVTVREMSPASLTWRTMSVALSSCIHTTQLLDDLPKPIVASITKLMNWTMLMFWFNRPVEQGIYSDYSVLWCFRRCFWRSLQTPGLVWMRPKLSRSVFEGVELQHHLCLLLVCWSMSSQGYWTRQPTHCGHYGSPHAHNYVYKHTLNLVWTSD